MGQCAGKIEKPSLDKLSELQILLLEKIFNDVAARSLGSSITKENFCLIFHLRGLWGQLIFNKFKMNGADTISFEHLKDGIQRLGRGSFDEKVHVLFEYFDIDHKEGISYIDLLKMLYSYTTTELRQITKSEQFMKEMTPDEKELYFDGLNIRERAYLLDVIPKRKNATKVIPKKLLSEQINIQIQPGMSVIYKQVKLFHHARSVPNPLQNQQIIAPSQPSEITNAVKPKVSETYSIKTANTSATIHKIRKIGSSQTQLINRQVRIVSKISFLVNKYARFIFAKLNLNPQTDRISQPKFYELVHSESRIFSTYFDGFLQQIWATKIDRVPSFAQKTPELESSCVELDEKNGSRNNMHMKLYGNIILLFRGKKDKVPEDIKCLEGLIVKDYRSGITGQIGFILKHRDGIYPEKAYLFHNKQTADHWLQQLSPFKQPSVPEIYEFKEKLGAGAFSRVYRGIHKTTGQVVAIKLIEKYNFSASQRHIIEQQAAIHSRCSHMNICSYTGKSQTKTHLYIVTQYLPDGDLQEYVYQRQFLEEQQASIIMRQLFEAVQYLHSLGVLHRDLKPENIMVIRILNQIKKCQDKQTVEKIKIIDLGLAIYKDTLYYVPEKQKYVGTPNYTPPEIYRGHSYDEKVDAFSLGVIMYYLLSGTLPFDSEFPEEIVSLTVECKPPMESYHWKNISEEAKSLIKGLICDKSERLTIGQALKHSWIRHPENLASYNGANKKHRYI